jgi:crotonobetaine/carnitine-CoA ligase
LQSRLGKHQQPRYIALIDEFHYTPSERLVKHVLSRRLDDCIDTHATPETVECK